MLVVQIVSLCCCALTGRAATVAYWKFDGGFLDLSGNGNTAIATGTSFTSDVFGTPIPRTGSANTSSLDLNNSFSFSPPSPAAIDYLSVPHDTSLDIATGSFTIEAWVRLDESGSDPARYYVAQQKDGSSTDPFSSFIFMAKVGGVRSSGDQSVMGLGLPDESSTNMIYSTLGFPGAVDNDWHYISVAVDRPSGDVRFVLDDQVELLSGAASSLTGMNNGETLYIGAHSTGSGANHGFAGGIDELRISNTFLPESQLLVVPEPATIAGAVIGLFVLTLLIGYQRCARRHFDAV